MSLKLGKLDVRCENISQFCPEGDFLRISSHFEKIRNDMSLHNPFPGVYETLMYL